jgi:uncharacterized protein
MKAEKQRRSKLRFNFGHLLDGALGAFRDVELEYPTVEVGEVALSPLEGRFRATRTSKGIYLKGQLDSTIETECTRCLATVRLPIVMELDDLFYHPVSAAPPGEFTIDEDGILDLAPLLRELSLLEIPMQVYCREGCKGICVQCGQDLNAGTCDCVFDDIDPRMVALKALLDED